MNSLPGTLFQRWTHSFEEDVGDETVYRPAEYDFPRARGRSGVEFRRDGTFVDWDVGPADAQQGVTGRWQVEAPGRVRLSFDRARASEVLEILKATDEQLRLRRRPATS